MVINSGWLIPMTNKKSLTSKKSQAFNKSNYYFELKSTGFG